MKYTADYEGRQVLVLGLAKSGFAAAKLLHRLGAQVIVNEYKQLASDDQLKITLEEMGITVIDGGHPETILTGIELIVKNPGIPYSNSVLVQAKERNIPIVVETDIAAQVSEAPMIAITGTNGKTTTTTLLHAILTADGQKPLFAGNIGEVVSEVVLEATRENVLVTELSSFQLMASPHLHPQISLLLNFDEAHLDYHTDLEEYHGAKAKIFQNQTEADYCVYNADDHRIVAAMADCQATQIGFSQHQPTNGAYVANGWIYYREEAIIGLEKVVLPGKHNVENMLAAITVAKLSQVKTAAIIEVLQTFSGVKHRLQFVKKKNGHYFYNDSKATNIQAAKTALASFQRPIVWLAGGLDRGVDFTELRPYCEHVAAIVTFGETANKFVDLAQALQVSVAKAGTMSEAVAIADAFASDEAIVLLSPACASWDQYASFEVRGDAFLTAIEQLPEGE
ncbi:MAG: UDP-N-acetylmuramoyl-L-alanine--D-glutamate ligase [Culicoidibacterales bacterium]